MRRIISHRRRQREGWRGDGSLGAFRLPRCRCVLFFGNFRVVSGAGLIKRQYFGFDEPFASVADCTSGPWLVVSVQHGPLCSDLQAAEVLESDEDHNRRIESEVAREMQDIQRQVEQEQRDMMRQLGY